MIDTAPYKIGDPTGQVEIWDNSIRSKNLITIFWILTVVTVIGAFSDYLELELLKNLQLGHFDETEVYYSDLRQGITGIIQGGLYIASAVLFLFWFRRAYGNLHRSGINYLRHKESMAVWSWFIPFISLYRPVQIMNEIWIETQERIKRFDRSYLIKSGGLILGIWWTLFLISSIIARLVLKTAFKDDTIEQVIEGSQAILISDIIQIPEALMIIIILYQVSGFENKLAEEVKKSGGTIIYKKKSTKGATMFESQTV